MKKIFHMMYKFLVNPEIRFGYLNKMGCYRYLTDEQFLKRRFARSVGYPLDLETPKTFNEKMQWLKLYNRHLVHTTMVDKYSVKEFVSNKVGDKFVIPLLGVWDSVEDISYDTLPEQFVLKTTHDCGGVVVCKNKNIFDKKKAEKFLKKHLKYQYYYNCREWPYKNVKPRIIAEKFMKDGSNDYLPVYKFFCFSGEVKIIQVIQNDKQPNESIDYFDSEWNLLKFRQNFPNSVNPLSKPEKLEEMIQLASKLAEDMSFIRVDLYLINNQIYFSEYTFYSDAGFAKFEPEEWDEILGEWVVLPQKEMGDN